MSKAGHMVHDVAKHSIYGIIWILVNNLNLSIQSATIKELCSSLSSAQTLFLYKFVVWACLFMGSFYRTIIIFLKEFLNVNGIIALIIGFIGAIITLLPWST